MTESRNALTLSIFIAFYTKKRVVDDVSMLFVNNSNDTQL